MSRGQRPMTRAQALRRAREIWGKSTAGVRLSTCTVITSKAPDRMGQLVCLDHGPGCRGDRTVYQVGAVELGAFFMVKGSGDTWEAAFEDARAKGRC